MINNRRVNLHQLQQDYELMIMYLNSDTNDYAKWEVDVASKHWIVVDFQMVHSMVIMTVI